MQTLHQGCKENPKQKRTLWRTGRRKLHQPHDDTKVLDQRVPGIEAFDDDVEVLDKEVAEYNEHRQEDKPLSCLIGKWIGDSARRSKSHQNLTQGVRGNAGPLNCGT